MIRSFNMNKINFIILTIICLLNLSIALPQIGDHAEIRIWYDKQDSRGGNGFSSGLKLADIESAPRGTKNFVFVFDDDNGGKCPFPVPPEGFRIGLQYANRKPDEIISGSSRLVNSCWITGINSNFGMSGSAELYFPVLASGMKYEASDWYLIRLSDTIIIDCKYDTESRAFLGTVKRITDGDVKNGATIIDGDKYAVYTNDSPFRIAKVIIHSSVTKLVNPQFSGFGEGYYGISIGAFRSGKMIQQNNRENPAGRNGRVDSRARRLK